jgi:AraC-like DNA-binding protein
VNATQPRTASGSAPAAEGGARDLVAPSVLSSWTRTIVDALIAMNADVEAVLEAAGLSRDAFKDPNGRLPMTASARLWRAAAEHLGDPAFGLRASKYVHQTTFHALGYAVFASETLRDALHRLVRYSHLVSDAGELRLETTPELAQLSFVFRNDVGPPSFEAIDAVMSLIVRTGRTLTTREFTLRWVEQRRPEPVDPIPYQRFFRCPVQFGRELDVLTIEAEVLDRPLPTANAELASHNDELIRQYLARLSEGNIVHRLRALLVEHLSGDPSPSQLGALLGLSARSLQRRLSEQGTTYGALLAETRRELACEYLREPRYSVTEITFLLGFEDASAFARAFRRWMGISPSEYRAQVL